MTDVSTVFHDLVRLEIELWNAADARLQDDCDLPLTWFGAMKVVSQYGGCRVYDIAKELAITMGGTSKLVDRIEASGLCRRRPNPDDARSSIIELTPAGRRRLSSATEALDEELQAKLRSCLSAHDFDGLARTLRTLRAALRSPGADGVLPRTAS